MAEDDQQRPLPFSLALIAGGCAGTSVDVALYPLDTLRTRLQSPAGFWAAGGFSGVYRGVVATALGASPGAALFFSAYETMKPTLKNLNGGQDHWLLVSASSSFAGMQKPGADYEEFSTRVSRHTQARARCLLLV